MTPSNGIQPLFDQLRSVFAAYAPSLDVQTDAQDTYHLRMPRSDQPGKKLAFGTVRLKKSYVSVHLLPVSLYPELLDEVDPELKMRMLGKSYFNFRRMNDAQLQAISRLTRCCFEKVREEGLA